LALLAAAAVIRVTRLWLALTLVLLARLCGIAGVVTLRLTILVLLGLLVALRLAALLSGVPSLICHRDVSSFHYWGGGQ
jgi:hypothetical protein